MKGSLMASLGDSMTCPQSASFFTPSLSVLSASLKYNALSNCLFSSRKLQWFLAASIS